MTKGPVAVDRTAPDGPAQLIRRAIEEHGRLDVLVNNVGAVRMRTEGFFGTSDEDFAWAMQMNFFIALRASRAALTEMVSSALLGIPHETPGQPAQITPFGRNRPHPGQATAERQIGGS